MEQVKDNTEIQDQENNWDLWITIAAFLLVIGSMIGSFSISYPTMLKEAIFYGMTSNPQLLPMVLDGAIMVFSILMIWGQFKNSQEVISYGWNGVKIATFFTWFFSVGHSPWIKAWATSGWDSVEFTWLAMLFQAAYHSVAPLMLAASLHGLTLMLEKIVQHGKRLAELIAEKTRLEMDLKAAETQQSDSETAAKQFEMELQAALDSVRSIETQLNESESERSELQTQLQRTEGSLVQANQAIERLEKEVQEREIAYQIVSLMDETMREFFAQVVVAESISQNKFATQYEIPSTTLSRARKLITGGG